MFVEEWYIASDRGRGNREPFQPENDTLLPKACPTRVITRRKLVSSILNVQLKEIILSLRNVLDRRLSWSAWLP